MVTVSMSCLSYQAFEKRDLRRWAFSFLITACCMYAVMTKEKALLAFHGFARACRPLYGLSAGCYESGFHEDLESPLDVASSSREALKISRISLS